MKLKGIFRSVYLLFLCTQISAQDPQIDSLKEIISHPGEDSAKISALLMLSNRFSNSQPEEAIKYGEQARDLAQKTGDKKGKAYALKYIGLAYHLEGKNSEALVVWNQSLALFQEIKYEEGISNILNNVGTVYTDQGDDELAIGIFLKSLKAAQNAGNKHRIATVYQNIGSLYGHKKNTYDLAVEYFVKAIQLGEEQDYKDVVGISSVNLGEMYLEKNQDDSALYYYFKSLKTLRNSDEEGSIPYAYNSIGRVYRKRKDYQTALAYHQQALDAAIKARSKLDIAQSDLGLADTYLDQGNTLTALSYYKQVEPIARELNSKEELRRVYQGKAMAYAKSKDYSNAFKYQMLLSDIKDSIYDSETEKKLVNMEDLLKIQQKEGEINLLTKDKDLQELELKRQRFAKNALIGGLIMVFFIVLLMYRDWRIKKQTNKILDFQKAEIERLLLNILPAEVAGELRTTGKSTPRFYESVSVLFTDFKGFTSIADSLSPQEIVSELSANFMAFDNVIERYGLEKIKTIGDAYMCAGGIPSEDPDHPVKIIKAAMEIQQYMQRRNEKRKEIGLPPWELRIGINTGQLVAGVVGSKKYAYDIWGSAVNIASRMESNGEPGEINISESTYQLVRNKFVCIHRGKIFAKNIGEIDMYFVKSELSKKTKSSVDSNESLSAISNE